MLYFLLPICLLSTTAQSQNTGVDGMPASTTAVIFNEWPWPSDKGVHLHEADTVEPSTASPMQPHHGIAHPSSSRPTDDDSTSTVIKEDSPQIQAWSTTLKHLKTENIGPAINPLWRFFSPIPFEMDSTNHDSNAPLEQLEDIDFFRHKDPQMNK